MDSWPADDRTHNGTASGKKRKGKNAEKEKEKRTTRNYPDLTQGSNLLNLSEKDNRLEWASILKTTKQDLDYLRMGKPTTIFPPTRPPPVRQVHTTISKNAEQEANFLRTYLPDVDIPAELIRDEVAQDARVMRALQQFDPYSENILETVTTYDSRSRNMTYLAFPMGELNRDLNLSCLRHSENDIIFKPSAHPVLTFETPIQQIVASKNPFTDGELNSYLAIRTYGNTTILEVAAGATSKATPSLSEVATILQADTANRALVDISLSHSPFGALVINDQGILYQCSIVDGQKSLNVIHASVHDHANQDSFWRLARTADNAGCLVASSKVLTHVDLRSNDPVKLFTLSKSRDVLTSVEDYTEDDIIRLCSTREILWIDRRFPGKPLLGYRHGRQYDRSLEARTIPLPTASTMVTSRRNGMVTVYDVSRPDGDLIHLNTPPYCLLPEKGVSAPHLGQTFVGHPLDTDLKVYNLIRLSERGSLSHVDLRSSDSSPGSTFETLWTTEVKQLEKSLLPTSPIPFENQDFTETDLIDAYDSLFRLHVQQKQKEDEENAPAVYDLLEKFPTFWQEYDAPAEHMLTTYDAVVRAGDDPPQGSRADFLSDNIINSTRGYRAVIQGRLSAQSLAKGASWHHNITSVLQHFDKDFTNNVQSCVETLHRYDLAEDPERSASSIRQENEAREQLALDLALSADVFSSQEFFKASHEEGSELEAMTKTLSLAGEPPSVGFGYLQPLRKNHYDKKEAEDFMMPIGVRSLLKDWETGANPEEFIFTDHYDDSVVEQPIRRMKSSQTSQQPQVTQSQRPPMIVAATSTIPPNPPEVTRRPVAAQSQGSGMPSRPFAFGSQLVPTGISESSQLLPMMSTQVLPGVYGGRPTVGKKKVPKKRVGGF
ncbi:hypothetical protein Hypma_011691 [Hypsizygus marmoreus]|uniref:Uncharacterized protein n=1 Tax=Hypsizygus marmoreus TaxID=39966 RepID=A0A369JK69_HYPMA|nr:hypothetical protein Hypma_011691 [Hypsizygus marmoreus]